MTTNPIQAAQDALNQAEQKSRMGLYSESRKFMDKAIAALAAIPVQEPVAWAFKCEGEMHAVFHKSDADKWEKQGFAISPMIYASPLPAAQQEKTCDHSNGTTPHYDWVTCNDCGAIHTGSIFGIAKNKWFKDEDEARFYQKNGRLPS